MVKTRRRMSALLISLMALVSGCVGAGRPGYVRDYEAGRLSVAYRAASAAASQSTGQAREQAALIAGLSAHALGDAARSSDWLTPLLASSDRAVSGRAAAALGLLAADHGDHERAVSLLAQASVKLTGEDAAQAAFHAGESLTALGRRDAAAREYRRAFTLAKDAALKNTLTERLSGLRYTIQLGAYSSRRNAQRARRSAVAATAGLGIGSPRVIAMRRDGRTLFVVQVGEFRTDGEADDARRRLGADAVVAVAPID